MPCFTQPFDPSVGPVIDVLAAPSGEEARDLLEGTPAHGAVRCRALMDTGAAVTCISPKIAEKLNLQVRGKREMAHPAGTKPANIYYASLVVLFPGGIGQISSVEVMEYFGAAEHDVLLGRDTICNAGGVFTLNGHEETFTLCM